jgi:phage nucleotide-binding protein
MPKTKTNGIEDLIHDMEDEISDLKNNYVVYGPNGAGKTTFVSYLQQMMNLFFIDAEGGRSSIIKTPNRPKIFQPKSDEPDMLREAYVYLKAHEDEYDAVAIDTMTEIEQWFIDDVIRTQCKRDPNKDKDLATQSDYNKASMRMRRTARLFRDLDIVTVFIMHIREDKDESKGVINYSPAVMPSVFRDINSFTDFIFYLGLDKNSNRNILTQPTKNFVAKHRIGDLPDSIKLGKKVENCRMDKVLKMIDKTKGQKKGDDK